MSADGWKLTDAEISAALESAVFDDDRSIADAAGRKALEHAAKLCEAEAARWRAASHCEAEENGALSCAAAVREGAKP